MRDREIRQRLRGFASVWQRVQGRAEKPERRPALMPRRCCRGKR